MKISAPIRTGNKKSQSLIMRWPPGNDQIPTNIRELARLDGIRSNQLFDVLEDWNEILKDYQQPFGDPRP